MLRTGILGFTGRRKIDPSLDIDAESRMADYIVEIRIRRRRKQTYITRVSHSRSEPGFCH
jgi:hypothetical protein